uniref:RING-type domain-containing protein n=1 Tax=Cynoglossus semilaevis TaxID=244447 RepID=A0A3P8VS21_CYNSE
MPSRMDHVETALLHNGGEQDDTAVGGGSALLSSSGMAMLPSGVFADPGYETEPSLLTQRKSVNTTECVSVPSSEHVAEIVGRQGESVLLCTPVRGEQPVFVVTGRKEDVAKREILSAAEHFSLIRASRNKMSPLSVVTGPGVPTLPGQTTIQVRVPYRVVGLVVGPKGATIKRIQQQSHTYIVTPSRDKEPVFEVTGMPENVDRAREEIEAHIALRTGTGGAMEVPGVDNNDFQYNGTDVSFDSSTNGTQQVNSNINSAVRMSSNYRNDSSSSLGSSSSLADSFNTGTTALWFGESLLSVASEELLSLGGGGSSSSGFEPLTISTAQTSHPAIQPNVWSSFVDHQPLQAFDGLQSQTSQPGTPRLSPTFSGSEALEHPQAQCFHQGPFGSARALDSQRFSSYSSAFSSSRLGSAEDRGQEVCIHCMDNQVIAALVPCGHNLFCLDCATQICKRPEAVCPVCLSPAMQAIH